MSSAALPMGTDVRTVEPYVVQAWMYGVLAVAFVVFFWPTLYALHGRWSSLDEAYAHGYLIVGLSVYFLWLQRERLRHAQAESERRWLPALAALAAAWSTAQIVGVELAGELVLPLLAVAAVYVLGGRAVAAIVAFPLAMIYVGVPIWEDLFGTPLRKATTCWIRSRPIRYISVTTRCRFLAVASSSLTAAAACRSFSRLSPSASRSDTSISIQLRVAQLICCCALRSAS